MQVKVTFKTARPLSSDAGMKFWERASHFTAVPGAATYQLTVEPVVDKIQDGIDAAVDLVEKIVDEEHMPWAEVIFTKVHADMAEE